MDRALLKESVLALASPSPVGMDLTQTSHPDCSLAGNERSGRRLQTSVQATANMLKSACGPGCLALAYSCSKVSTGTAVVVMMALQGCCVYNMQLLTSLKQHFEGRGVKTYGDLGQQVFGKPGRYLIELCTVLQQLGICTVYFAFVASGVDTACTGLGLDLARIHVKRIHLMMIEFLVLCPLSFIRHWGKLAPLAMVANVCILSGIVIALWSIIHRLALQGLASKSQRTHQGATLSNVPLLFGAVVYSFELIANVLPIENTMAEARKVKRVILQSMSGYCVIMIMVGVLPVLSFGGIQEGSLIDELGHRLTEAEGQRWVIVADLLVVIAVVLTYPVQLYPACEIVERYCGIGAGTGASTRLCEELSMSLACSPVVASGVGGQCVARRSLSHRAVIVLRLAVRSGCVLGTLIVASAVPDVGLLVSMCGSVAAPMLVMILPPCMALLVVDFPHTVCFRWLSLRPLHLLILACGIVGAVTGSAVAACNIINA